MRIEEITGLREAYLPLLMLADEGEEVVRKYLDDGQLFAAASGDEVLGVALYVPVDEETRVEKYRAGRSFPRKGNWPCLD